MKRAKTATFLLELPLSVDWSQESHLRAHLQAARCLYNALLAEGYARLRQMRNHPAWAEARSIPRWKKLERAQAFSALRKTYHFSEYELHAYAKHARVSWIADHIESTMAQTLATRAYRAVNRVCVGKAKRVRYVRLIRRKAPSPRAQGSDTDGNRYCVQLVLEGHAFIKPKHEQAGTETIGLDIGPSTLAIVPQQAKADLLTFCEELAPDSRKKRRLQRKMERQRRANNPEHYDALGRVKKHGKSRLRWKESKRYKASRRQYASAERKLAAHRKSLHGKLAHTIAKVGNTIKIEKTSFKGWQKQYGRSMGLRAPGLFVAHLTRRVAKTGGTLSEISAYKTRLSQYCHQCGRYVKKPRSQRWHACPCGLGPVQRDLYAAFLLAHLEPEQTTPSVTRHVWEGAEPRRRPVMQGLQQRANEGQHLPPSMGVLASGKAARARARRLQSPAYPHQEPVHPQGATGSVG